MFWNRKVNVQVETDAVRVAVEAAIKNAIQSGVSDVQVALSTAKDVDRLKREVASLEIARDKKQEEFARREREVEHMVGLERKRQEFETDAAKREATVSVREENLKADRTRFEEQMKFQSDRFTQEVGYLKGMLERVLEAIPNVAPAPKRGRK